MSYWAKRSHKNYYRKAVELAQARVHHATAVVDVGGRDCLYSLEIPAAEHIVVDPQGTDHPDLRVIRKDFMRWEADQVYDLGFCLQVLEHVEDPAAFLRKLLGCCRVAVVSVPFNWPPTWDHLHNYLQPEVFTQWAGRQPAEVAHVSDPEPKSDPAFWNRMIAVFAEPAAG